MKSKIRKKMEELDQQYVARANKAYREVVGPTVHTFASLSPLDKMTTTRKFAENILQGYANIVPEDPEEELTVEAAEREMGDVYRNAPYTMVDGLKGVVMSVVTLMDPLGDVSDTPRYGVSAFLLDDNGEISESMTYPVGLLQMLQLSASLTQAYRLAVQALAEKALAEEGSTEEEAAK